MPKCTANKRGHRSTRKALLCPVCGPKTRRDIRVQAFAKGMPPLSGPAQGRAETALPINKEQGVKPQSHNVGQVCHVKEDIYMRKGKKSIFEDWSDTCFEQVVVPEGSPDFRFTSGERISMIDCVSHVSVQLGEDAHIVGGTFHESLIMKKGSTVEGSRVGHYSGVGSEVTGLLVGRAEVDNGFAEIAGGYREDDYPFVMAGGSAHISMQCPGIVMLEEESTLSADDPSRVVIKEVTQYGFLDMSSRTRLSLAMRPKDDSEGLWLDARNEAAWKFIVDSNGLSTSPDSKQFEVDENALAISLRLHENPA